MYIRGAMSDTHPMLRSVLKSQYHASLAMLREAIERCPPEEWVSIGHKNAFWQVSYHTLFFAHLYLQCDEAAFCPWEQHRGERDGIEGEPYTQTQVVEYWEFCDRMVDAAQAGTPVRQYPPHPASWRATDRPCPLGRRRRDWLGSGASGRGTMNGAYRCPDTERALGGREEGDDITLMALTVGED